ncbi:MAG: hypothetical protein KDC87_18885 [Planctomycetes bacterium]|nr:hypothetical protein [Planctomycetota bacterium]MCB9888026.1 hypothetical protein [Planctomycetota bacterium]
MSSSRLRATLATIVVLSLSIHGGCAAISGRRSSGDVRYGGLVAFHGTTLHIVSAVQGGAGLHTLDLLPSLVLDFALIPFDLVPWPFGGWGALFPPPMPEPSAEKQQE